jgi:DNA-binding CsgD family transcriptional regulator
VLLMLPQALAFQGDAGAARTTAETAIESAAEFGDVRVGGSYLALSVAHLAAGDIELAADAAEAAWTHVSELYGTASLDSAYIAETALARGDLTAARRRLDDALAVTAGWFRAAALKTRARVAIVEGKPEEAERDAHAALACSAGVKAYLGVPDILEILADLIGASSGHGDSARLFGAADGIRERTGEVRFPVYQAGYESSVEVVRNSMGDAEFESAWAEGTALSVEEAIAYAQRGRGERKRPNSGWASLTPTELDVVRLVSEGLGNSDIATRLFVSPRTVQTHLTHVYTKLGLSSRVQLVQEAARHT